MYRSKCVPERIQQAEEKLALVTEYLDLCDMHHDGNISGLQGVILVLSDIEDDLHFASTAFKPQREARYAAQ